MLALKPGAREFEEQCQVMHGMQAQMKASIVTFFANMEPCDLNTATEGCEVPIFDRYIAEMILAELRTLRELGIDRYSRKLEPSLI